MRQHGEMLHPQDRCMHGQQQQQPLLVAAAAAVLAWLFWTLVQCVDAVE
jgi:hypothetical protein